MGLVGTKAEIDAVGSAGVDRAILVAEPQNFPLPLADALRVLKNFLSQAGSNLAAQAFAFFSTAYIARRLQAQGFGWIGFAQGFLTYFTLVTDLGLRTIGLREVAKHSQEVAKWVSPILGLRIALACLSFTLFLGTVALLPKSREFKWFLVEFGFLIFASAFFLDWVFQGLERMELPALGEVLRTASYLGMVLVGLRGPSQIFRIPVFTVLSQLLPVGFLLGIFWRQFHTLRPSIDVAAWKNLLRQSLPLSVGGLAAQFATGLDVVLLGLLRPESEVGYYSAASRLVFLPSGLTGAIGFAMFPVMSRYWKDQPSKLGLLTRYLGKLLVLIGFPTVIGGWFSAPSFLSFVYGRGFLPATLSFRILLGYLLVAHIYCPFFYLLPACGKEKAFMKSMMAGAVVGVLANLTLIPFYGAPGAAIAKVLAHLVILLDMHRATCKQIVPVPLAKDILRSALLAMPMGVVMVLTPAGWLVKLGAGLTAYLGLLAASERKVWARVIRRGEIRLGIAQE